MKFRFVSPDQSFQCAMQCGQCEGITNSGQRCKRKVCTGVPLCPIHLKKEMHLKIALSKLKDANRGLFAFDPAGPLDEVVFRKGSIIADYGGDNITDEELNERYGQWTGPYAVRHYNGGLYDAACNRGIGSIVNRPNRSHHANAKLISGRNKIRVKAIKNIRNNEEILASYGRQYKMNEPTHHFSR